MRRARALAASPYTSLAACPLPSHVVDCCGFHRTTARCLIVQDPRHPRGSPQTPLRFDPIARPMYAATPCSQVQRFVALARGRGIYHQSEVSREALDVVRSGVPVEFAGCYYLLE